jgi:lipopolysaccharide transport system permease protein
MTEFSANPPALAQSLWRNRRLLWDLGVRDAMGRYKSSYLGVFWALATPLMMLAVYAFVFTQVFKSKWDAGAGATTSEFAVVLFAGLIVFNIFAEGVVRAPSAIVSVPNYVKKIVFPLEILPVVSLVSSLIHFFISLVLLLAAQLIATGSIPTIAWLLPVALVPLIASTLGLGWLLASLGVYIRDIGHIISVCITALMFLSPVFYPLSAVPERWRWATYLKSADPAH